MPAGCSSRSWPPPDRDTARLRAAADGGLIDRNGSRASRRTISRRRPACSIGHASPQVPPITQAPAVRSAIVGAASSASGRE